jgi:hypothetical protein
MFKNGDIVVSSQGKIGPGIVVIPSPPGVFTSDILIAVYFPDEGRIWNKIIRYLEKIDELENTALLDLTML